MGKTYDDEKDCSERFVMMTKIYLERVVKVTVVINERIHPSYTMDVTRNTTWVQSHTFDSSTCVPYTHTRYSYMNGFSKQEEEVSSPFIHGGDYSCPICHTHTHAHVHAHNKKPLSWQVLPTTPAIFPSNFVSQCHQEEKEEKPTQGPFTL